MPNTPAKRTRFDPTAAMPTGEDSTTAVGQPSGSPTAMAESFIRKHVQSLHPQIATILERLGLRHLKLLVTANNKAKHIRRMTDDQDFVPRSARVNFEFHVSKPAEESPEFTALREDTNDLIAAFQRSLTQKILAVTRLEHTLLTRSVQDDFIESLRVIVRAFLIVGEKATDDVDVSVYSLVHTYQDTLFEVVKLDLDAFVPRYKTAHNINSFPSAAATAAATAGVAAAAGHDSDRDDSLGYALAGIPPAPAVDPCLANIHRAIVSVFVEPWKLFLRQQRQNDIHLELKKLSTAHFTEKATVDAAMDVDAEPAADRRHLGDLIRKATQDETRQLQRELQSVRSQLAAIKQSPKNAQRGRPQNGASKKKSRSRQGGSAARASAPDRGRSASPGRARQAHRPAGKAGDAANGSSDGNGNNKKASTTKSGNRQRRRQPRSTAKSNRR